MPLPENVQNDIHLQACLAYQQASPLQQAPWITRLVSTVVDTTLDLVEPHLRPTDNPILEVHELGEDGDSWLVTGTAEDTHEHLIHIEVGTWLLNTCGFDEYCLETLQKLPTGATLTFRPDWGYVPLNPDDLSDECRLVYGDSVPPGIKKFTGTRVQL
ncbi:hypothetical protein ANMWB30_24930 [Arthrobacter sp. MWB30]|nr:hypothetical protein ANMWB30_24930 [Arthrobacter sp. MWB30]